jgi:hypothetical protein
MLPLANLVIGASGQPDVCGSVGDQFSASTSQNEFPDSVRWIMEPPFTAGPDVNESTRRGKCRLHSPGRIIRRARREQRIPASTQLRRFSPITAPALQQSRVVHDQNEPARSGGCAPPQRAPATGTTGRPLTSSRCPTGSPTSPRPKRRPCSSCSPRWNTQPAPNSADRPQDRAQSPGPGPGTGPGLNGPPAPTKATPSARQNTRIILICARSAIMPRFAPVAVAGSCGGVLLVRVLAPSWPRHRAVADGPWHRHSGSPRNCRGLGPGGRPGP